MPPKRRIVVPVPVVPQPGLRIVLPGSGQLSYASARVRLAGLALCVSGTAFLLNDEDCGSGRFSYASARLRLAALTLCRSLFPVEKMENLALRVELDKTIGTLSPCDPAS